MKEISCGAIVYKKINNKTYFLIIQNINSKSFGFPKGHLEKDETLKEAAIREVLEETGINIEIISEKHYTSSYKFVAFWNNEEIDKEVHIFLAKAINTNITHQKEEVLSAVWLEEDEVLDLLTYANDREIFEKAIKENNL